MTKEIVNIPDCFYRVSIKALILDNQKRFLLTFENKGWWELPGGGLDFGEKPAECLIREIKEEMGLDVIHINEQPSYFVTALHKNGKWFCNIIYEVIVKDLNFTPSDECMDLRFFTKEEASKENLFLNVMEFVKIYNPDNHNKN
ncbi:MAG: NUDIX hydrolase [Parcubacteria group bacterium]|jgi:8-oxo-dGTP pyrophosphatase MutT (NUDIX family)